MSKIEHAINNALKDLEQIRGQIVVAIKEKDILISEISSQRAALFLVNEEINAKKIEIQKLNIEIEQIENQKNLSKKQFFELQNKFSVDVKKFEKTELIQIKDPNNFEEYNKTLKQQKNILLFEISEKTKEFEIIEKNLKKINSEILEKQNYLQEEYKKIENEKNILKKKEKRLKLEEERIKLLKSKK